MELEQLVFNLTGLTREETLDGKTYLVRNAVMMTPGVRTGSLGAVLYNETFLAKRPSSWDMKPIVCYHPVKDGSPITACNSDVINTRGVGILMNTKMDGSWKTECWFDKEKTKKVDEPTYNAVVNNEPLEISTGLLLELNKDGGEYNGAKYTMEALDYSPDHLAVFPPGTIKGACSNDHGCGCGGKFAANASESVMNALNLKGMSISDLQSEICDLLCAKFGEPGKSWYGYVLDVYDGYVIYSTGAYPGGYYQQDYAIDKNGDVSLVGDSVEVERKTTFVPTSNEAGLFFTSNSEECSMSKKEKIDALIAKGLWLEADREWLSAQNDGRIDRLLANEVKVAVPAPGTTVPGTLPAQGTTPAQNQGTPVPGAPIAGNAGSTVVVPPATTAPPAPANWNDWMKMAPPEAQQMVNNWATAFNEEKAKLVEVILANPANRFTAEQLAAKNDIHELKAIAALAAVPAAAQNQMGGWTNPNFNIQTPPPAPLAPVLNFTGAGGAPPPAPAANAGQNEVPLKLPSFADMFPASTK